MFVERHQAEVEHEPTGVEAVWAERVTVMHQPVRDAVAKLWSRWVEEHLLDVECQVWPKDGFDVGSLVAVEGGQRLVFLVLRGVDEQGDLDSGGVTVPATPQ